MRPTPDAARNVPDTTERQVQRIERLAGFGAELAAALRHEFLYFWNHPERRKGVPEAEEFVQKVEGLRTLTGRFLREAARARNAPPIQAMHMMRSLDISQLFEAGRGLEGRARALRPIGRERGWGPHKVDAAAPLAAMLRAGAEAEGWKWGPEGGTPTPAAPDTPREPGLTGRLKHWLGKVEAATIGPKAPVAPPVTHPGQRRLEAFEASLALVSDVVADTGPRLLALRIAHGAMGTEDLAAMATAARRAGLPLNLRDELPELSRLFVTLPPAARAAQVAVTQWGEANRLLADFETAREKAREATPEAVGAILRPLDLAKLKGLILPLTNLHLTFRGMPTLGVMFPPPENRRLVHDMPVSDHAKVVPQARFGDEPEPQEPPKTEREKKDEKAERLSWEETSQRRLGLIMLFMDDEAEKPSELSPTLVYRLIAEERTYQDDRVIDLGMRIRLLPPGKMGEPPHLTAKRNELKTGLAESRQLQVQLKEVQEWVAQYRLDGSRPADEEEPIDWEQLDLEGEPGP